MSENESRKPPLGKTVRDSTFSLIKGAAGAIPLAGGIIGEIIGQLIPQQRMERIEAYLRYLNARLDEQTTDSNNLKTPENIALFEDGAFQAARAISDTRIMQIANLVAHGMTGDEKANIETKRLLNLLGELDDDQIIVLLSYTAKYSRDGEFKKTHSKIISPERPHLNSPNDVRDAWAVSNIARDHLIRLGALKHNYGHPNTKDKPEFDFTSGTLKSNSLELTYLGGLLLRRLGLIERGQVFFGEIV